jgi:hypothetical protein
MVLKSCSVQCFVLVAAGCLFSAIAQLHGIAYQTIAAQTLFVPVVQLQRIRLRWRLHLRRFRSPLPLAFALPCFVAFLRGIFRTPNNYDGLSDRMPCHLTLLGAGHWTRIGATTQPLNYSATNFRRFDDRNDDRNKVETPRSFRAEMGGS